MSIACFVVSTVGMTLVMVGAFAQLLGWGAGHRRTPWLTAAALIVGLLSVGVSFGMGIAAAVLT